MGDALSVGSRPGTCVADADGVLEALGSLTEGDGWAAHVAGAIGVAVRTDGPRDFVAEVSFEGSSDAYVRREVVLPLGPREP